MAKAIIGRGGKTLAALLPRDQAHDARLKEGDHVEREKVDGEIKTRKPATASNIDGLFPGRSAKE